MMTEYETLSLRLLSAIATGVSLQISANNPAMQRHHGEQLAESVLDWQTQLLDTVKAVDEVAPGGPKKVS